MSDYSQVLKREMEEKKIVQKENYGKINDILEEDFEEQISLFPSKKEKKSRKRKKSLKLPTKQELIWLSLSEAAKIGGIQPKTLRRAIKSGKLKYKIAYNRYFINFESLILYLISNRKLINKFKRFGIGQYVRMWKNIKF